jgi:hypothetical protein
VQEGQDIITLIRVQMMDNVLRGILLIADYAPITIHSTGVQVFMTQIGGLDGMGTTMVAVRLVFR